MSEQFPTIIWIYIFEKLEHIQQLLRIQRVCKRFRDTSILIGDKDMCHHTKDDPAGKEACLHGHNRWSFYRCKYSFQGACFDTHAHELEGTNRAARSTEYIFYAYCRDFEKRHGFHDLKSPEYIQRCVLESDEGDDFDRFMIPEAYNDEEETVYYFEMPPSKYQRIN